ncbi:MAG: hypothetical protein H6737_15105 [Alphaproteobacteria bacterium]|nr:hypothetical protein [Alphaproteobacteria bacterium]
MRTLVPLLLVLATGCKTTAEDTGKTPILDDELPTGDPTVLALPNPGSVENGLFSTADACEVCHDNVGTSTAMRDDQGRAVAPYRLWQGTMMANAGRDPLWRAAVSAEVAATPSAQAAIEAKCARCHLPMASTDAMMSGDEAPGLHTPTETSERGRLARDGVSCTVCHQIEDQDLGAEASFSGFFTIAGDQVIYGPYEDPVPNPMIMHTGFEPTYSTHIRDSGLCATCHTLTTHALDASGAETGGSVVEQAPFLEWQISSWVDQSSCQGCHLPSTDEDGQPIATRIAHNPGGGEFAIETRSPYGRHLLVGGNTLIPAIIRDNAEILNPRATAAAFDNTIEAAREQLRERTATLMVTASRSGDTLAVDAQIEVHAGHKLPTGIPVRRTWLHTTVKDASGAVVFESGGYDDQGRLVDGSGALLPSERAGAPILPHFDQIDASDEAAVFEAILADGSGAPTFKLMRGEGWAKDDRLLPEGFDMAAAGPLGIAPVGTSGDPDFVGGGDTVHYAVPVQGATGPFSVEVELLYQPLSARWAAELASSGTPEALGFMAMLAEADRTPETIDAVIVSE